MSGRGPIPTGPFGPWLPEAEVGRGGTARVFRARHHEDASLRAALKLMKPGMASPEIRRGWALERETLARLQVPGVARLLGFGESDTAGPWIATEWVEGRPLDEALDEAGATFDQRLRLLGTLCATLHAVHQQGVVHGDVRSENILATGAGSEPSCTVVDFGLAGSDTEVDVRRDVGGLGEVLEIVIPTELRPRAHRADLDAVVARATAADLDARYPTAHALGEEVRRIREGEAVSVRRHDRRYRIARAARRHRRALATAAVVVAVTLGVVAVGLDAWQNARLARADAEQRLADLLLLSDVTSLERLEADAPALPPAEPPALAAYHAWIDEAEGVLSRVEARPLARAGAPPASEFDSLTSTSSVPARGPDRPTATERWRAEQMAALQQGVARFRSPDPRVSPLAFVAGRTERTELADSLARTDAVRRAWDEVRASVSADERFRGWAPTADPVLVPLGRHPDTALWHFWHVPSGQRPAPVEEGGWGARPGDGIVFVLLPGGPTAVGAQADDPAGPRWDPAADADESPVREVVLAPFHVAAHEMTRGQWIRTLGFDPIDGGDARPANQPVTGLAWEEARRGLARLHMTLPTEAQWEYAARGGTDTPWFTGADPASLAGHSANPFGLHDTAGSVWEWTSGIYGPYGEGTVRQPGAGFAPGTGELLVLDLGRRTIRGGGSNSLPILLRASNRSAGTLNERPAAVGVRPVRSAVGN